MGLLFDAYFDEGSGFWAVIRYGTELRSDLKALGRPCYLFKMSRSGLNMKFSQKWESGNYSDMDNFTVFIRLSFHWRASYTSFILVCVFRASL